MTTAELPPPVAAAALAAAEHLRTALLPHLVRATDAGPRLEAAKLLSAAGGGLELPDTPDDEQDRAQSRQHVVQCGLGLCGA